MDENTPEALQRRIDALREQQQRKVEKSAEPSMAHAMVLFLTMGFTVAATMGAGYYLGSQLAHRTGQILYLPLMLVFSVVASGVVVFQMLRPFLK